MTEHSLETSAAKKLQSTSVADYIVQRIADEGVTHCFGVAGDYLFPMCNAIESSQKVKCRIHLYKDLDQSFKGLARHFPQSQR